MEKIAIQEIIERHREVWKRADWFGDDAMAFFKTHLHDVAVKVPQGIFFADSSKGPDGKRRWSLRSFDWETGKIDTVGQFRGFASAKTALASIPAPMNFKFIEFDTCRAMSGVEAARVEVIHPDDPEGALLWMSRKNIKDNMRMYGEHPELKKALEAYGGKP